MKADTHWNEPELRSESVSSRPWTNPKYGGEETSEFTGVRSACATLVAPAGMSREKIAALSSDWYLY